jgi:hypothetical protein
MHLCSVFVLRQSRKDRFYAAAKICFHAALPHVEKQLRHSRNKKCTQKCTLIQLYSCSLSLCFAAEPQR